MNIEFIDLTEVQKDVVHCYAHRTGNEKKSMEQRQKETLIEHTELCQQYYEKIVEHKQIQVVFEQFEKLYFSDMSREGIHFFETMRDNVITFHDIGKINPRFQEKNMGNYELKGKARPDNSVGSKHSILSSVLYLDYFLDRVSQIENLEERKSLRDLAYIHSFLIAKHHGALTDFQTYLDSFASLNDTEGTVLGWHAQQWLKKWKEENENQKVRKKVYLKKDKQEDMLERISGDDASRQVYLFGYTRLLFSLYFKHPVFAERVIPDYSLLKQKMTLEILCEHVQKQVLRKKKILIEFISKKSAEKFYGMLTDTEIDCETLFMSGDSSIWERQKIIEKLSKLKSVILVATQVIEAGVDIDMDIGYKDCSKLDSEEQFMGRINRSCKGEGIVYFFNLDSARMVYKDGDIRVDTEFTVMKTDMQEILRTKNFSDYYGEILEIERNNKKSENENNIVHFFKKEVGQLAYPKVSDKMHLIDEQREMMNVFLSRTLTLSVTEKICGDEIWQEYESLLHDQGMDYSEQRVKLHEIKCKMKMFVYQIEKGNTFAWDEYEAIGDIYFIKDGDSYFENGVLNREKFGTGGEMFF